MAVRSGEDVIGHAFLFRIGEALRVRLCFRRHARYLQIAFSIALRTPHVRELVQYTLVPPRGQYRFFDMSILTSRWKHRKPFDALAGWTRTEARRNMILVP